MDLGLLVFGRGSGGEWQPVSSLTNGAFRELDEKIASITRGDRLSQRLKETYANAFDAVVQEKKTITLPNVEYRSPLPESAAVMYVSKRIFPVGQARVGVILEDTTSDELGRRAVELERAKSVQSAKLAALGEMAAGIAHELNNPLSIIKGHAVQLLKTKDSSPKERKSYDIVSATVDRMAKIIRGILLFSYDASADPTNVTPLSKIVFDTLEFCRVRRGYHGCTIEVIGMNEDQLLNCRGVEICQVLLHLLNNAFDAVAEHDEKKVTITVTENAENLFLAVEDSGPGIPAHVAEKLFQPFFSTKQGKGTGLGLSIARSIIEDHRGALVLESACPTRFVFRLPKDRATKTAEAA